MKTIFAILLSCLPALAQSNRLTFTWSANTPDEAILAYRFYEIVAGTNRVLLGITATNYFTVTNWNPLQPHTVTVTASNILGESLGAQPLVVPKAPAPPVNLAPVHLSLEATAATEISYDLVDWRQKVKLWTNAGKQMLTIVIYPYEPAMFARPAIPPSFTRPPTPRRRQRRKL